MSAAVPYMTISSSGLAAVLLWLLSVHPRIIWRCESGHSNMRFNTGFTSHDNTASGIATWKSDVSHIPRHVVPLSGLHDIATKQGPGIEAKSYRGPKSDVLLPMCASVYASTDLAFECRDH
ncbi:hypothetical protein E6O75_ATG01121 [Venturia nashicola]|uniref:Uncharacterized protein n=1 Tax=Venturia nashicola TaxID=86259 RepID=A0A4Z1PB58_9PEZI|nr:hypothetical protein E6O75_ATG01121 [Venturia nashicola]